MHQEPGVTATDDSTIGADDFTDRFKRGRGMILSLSLVRARTGTPSS